MSGGWNWLNEPLAHRAGWVLWHTVWQGALAAAVWGGLRAALRRRSAQARYLAGCGLLLALAVAPTLTWVWSTGGPFPTGPESRGPRLIETGSALPAWVGPSAHAIRQVVSPLPRNAAAWIEWTAPWVTGLWLAGVLLCACRLIRGCWWVRRLRTRSIEPIAEEWYGRLEDLKFRLGVTRPVQLLRSALVEVPTVIGWLRPVILLPASSLTGLPPAELEAILAHELAHIRRYDYLVNVCQNLVEVLLFYHPAVWWISRCIREEREHCCDDLVIRACSERLTYARALATLEELRARPGQLAFAAGGGPLLQRIRRLVGASPDVRPTSVREISALTLLTLGLALILTGLGLMIAPRAYRAMARIRVEREPSVSLGAGNNQLMLHWTDPYYIQTELVTMTSEPILTKAIEDLGQQPWWTNKYGRLGRVEARALLRERLDLRPYHSTALIDIRATAEQAEEAAALANAMADAYQNHRHTLSRSAVQSGLRALQVQWEEQRKRVQEAQQSLDQLRKDLNVVDTSPWESGDSSREEPSTRLSAEGLRRIETLRIETKAEYIRTETLMKKLGNLKPDALAQALFTTGIQDSLLGTLLEQTTLAEQKLVAAKRDFGPEHSDVVKLVHQVDDLKAKTRQRCEGIMAGLEAKAASIEAGLDRMQQEADQAIAREIDQTAKSQPYWTQKRQLEEYKRFEQVLSLKIASEQADLAMQKSRPVEIIERAQTPQRPSSPNRPRAAGALGLGLALAAAGVLMARRGDPSVALSSAAEGTGSRLGRRNSRVSVKEGAFYAGRQRLVNWGDET